MAQLSQQSDSLVPSQSAYDPDPYQTAPSQARAASFTMRQSADAQQPFNGIGRTNSTHQPPSGPRRPSASQEQPDSGYPPSRQISLDYPLPYQSQYHSEAGHHNPLIGSFAQRAAALTGRTKLPPNPNQVVADAKPEATVQKTERRQSLNRPIGGLYSEIQQHRRDSWPAGKSPTSPRKLSFPQSPQLSQDRQFDKPTTRDIRPEPQTAQIARTAERDSAPRRSVTMSSQPRSEQWASDRSPLQKLEVKMSDISKEEKRARVEQAERRIRDSRAAAHQQALRALEQKEPSSNQVISPPVPLGRPAGPRGPRGPDTIEPRSSSKRDTKSRKSRHASQGSNIDSRNDASRNRELVEDLSPFRPGGTPTEDEISESDTGISRHTLQNSNNGRPAGLLPPQQVNSGQRRQVLAEQPRPYEARAQPSGNVQSMTHNSTHTDRSVGPGDTGTPHRKDYKAQLPPQRTAGIRARQQVGFDGRVTHAVESNETQHRGSYLSHLGRDHSPQASAHDLTKVSPLEEWRAGGVARLESEDFEDDAKADSPWWEKKEASKSRRRSRRGSIGTADPYPEGNGEYSESLSSLSEGSTHSMPPIISRSYRVEDRARRISKKEILSALRKDDQRRSLRYLLRPAGQVTEYSYSCPSLAEHDQLHPTHICEPYMDKELIMSMRSVRIRAVPVSTSFSPPLYLKCGPLLRYTGMKRDKLIDNNDQAGFKERETWRGSVMIVTNDADSRYEPAPILRLFPEPMEKIPPPEPSKLEQQDSEDLPHHYLDPIAGLPKLSRSGKTVYVKPVDDLEHAKDLSKLEENDDGLFEEIRSAAVPTAYGTPEYRHGQAGPTKSKPKRGHRVKGVRLYAERGVTFWRFNLEVVLQSQETRVAYSINNGPAVGFWVPANGQTMNVMFHSCNGFSLSIDPDEYSGPDPLWRDVLNSHQTRPFHVMIGGGDQIYNDAVMKQSPLFGQWLETKSPVHKREAPFSHELQEELETFYLERYSMWFSQGLFGMANSQIPMVNLWDDHDIIDGFGSYPDHFMSTPVFCGLGAVAFKYYMLFQHQSVPAETAADEPSWLLGAGPGPYINELSRSVYMSLGKHVSFLGLDCRTERMREEVLSEASYDMIFERCRREIIKGDTKHLIVLLGVPIAYPRLVWLENVLTSRALDPIKAMGRMGILGNFLNKFDGGVEILDDLDDHWTAKNHKQERNWFVEELQELAADLSVRVTILSGDVHLAAVGQFVSSPKLRIPKDKDHRYMPNIISSAIVNAPPAEMMSDILNKRNKVHHLDPETDESMIPMFAHEADGKPRNNKRLLPRRNWCSIREYELGSSPPPTPPDSDSESESSADQDEEPKRVRPQRTLSLTRSDIRPRQLIRRLSGRAPKSYLASIDYATPSPPMTPKDSPQISRRSQLQRSSSNPQPEDGESPQLPPTRPTFYRRPTDLNDKTLANADPEDTAGHINLEHGLDVCIHSEINPKDPSGATYGYRLLVPALYYEGEGDENHLVYRRPNLLQRLSTFRTRAGRKTLVSPDHDASSPHAASTSEVDSTEADQTPPARPRRWSFGLEKRRQYRDQTPPPRNNEAAADGRPRRDPVAEARAMGALQDRPGVARQMQSPPQSAGSDRNDPRYASGNQYRSTGAAANKHPQYSHPQSYDGNESYDDDDGDDDSILHSRLDSTDYHANIHEAATDATNAPPVRRLSKVEKMLGIEDTGRQSYTQRKSSAPNDVYATTEGYGGIDAYPGREEKRGWRRSLSLFSKIP